MKAQLAVTALFVFGTAAGATDVTVVGLFPNKVVVQVDGGPLRTLTPGQKTPEGVTVVAVDRDSATFEIDGKRSTLRMGQARIARSTPAVESVTLTADLKGHFTADGQVNGRTVHFLVDTGATVIALPSGEAKRLGVDYEKGQKVLMRTANGTGAGYLVKLDSVAVGSVTLYGVEAVVVEGAGLALPLLGMSFLNRMDMKREGNIMTLTKRF
ncbi:MAG: TIGR02281 family clan AA aspartic protease [Burkholderiales bacterium]|nr:TIGR02281 family clan AA aspartic protease [Burkholderiales bacterium]